MTVQRMDHVGVNVDDLDAAVAFFEALGLRAGGRWSLDDERVGRIIALDDVRTEIAMMETEDGRHALELIRFDHPRSEGDASGPSNERGLRHVCFAVDDLDATLERLREHGGTPMGEVIAFGGTYRLCYLRGPEGIIVELAEPAD